MLHLRDRFQILDLLRKCWYLMGEIRYLLLEICNSRQQRLYLNLWLHHWLHVRQWLRLRLSLRLLLKSCDLILHLSNLLLHFVEPAAIIHFVQMAFNERFTFLQLLLDHLSEGNLIFLALGIQRLNLFYDRLDLFHRLLWLELWHLQYLVHDTWFDQHDRIVYLPTVGLNKLAYILHLFLLLIKTWNNDLFDIAINFCIDAPHHWFFKISRETVQIQSLLRQLNLCFNLVNQFLDFAIRDFWYLSRFGLV